MSDSPPVDPMPFGRSGPRGRTALGRFAGGLAQFLGMLGMAFLGLILGLIFASWYAMAKSATIPPAAPNGIGIAPDLGPAFSEAALWFVSLVTGGLVGLVVGLLAGIVLTRMVADSLARAREADGPGKP